MTEEWRVGDKKLYEVGLPGRYNKLGEWKPLIYPARSKTTTSLQRKALSLSEDEEIQGVLFYIMCTGHQVIEFVVKTDIEIPYEDVVFGETIHLWKCPKLDEIQNYRIYDGTYYLSSFDPQQIKTGISRIGIALNRMAFVYSAEIQWKLKYKFIGSLDGSVATLEEKDLDSLKMVMENFPQK
ncbi:MAG: hypothetical protein MUO89_04355, partial [Dehalococcoidia bacterium]|nr:hypothetical protein [Dehalococcoidia bacterium]